MTAPADTRLVIDNRPPLTDAENEQLIQTRLQALRNDAEARRRFDDERDRETTEQPTEPPSLIDELLNRSDLRDLPKPAPMIDEVLDQGTIALLYGRQSSLKSFIAIDWAASIATGRRWQNRLTKKGRALYIAAEGAFGMQLRVDAWEQGWHTTLTDEDMQVLPRRVNLARIAEVRELCALIRWNGYSFIVVDTLSKCMVGADENSAKDCGLVVDALARMREATPGGVGVVVGVHHTGKDGKTFRGSSVFEAGADTVYAATREGVVTRLQREKRKDGPPTDFHELRFDEIDGTDSGVIISAGGFVQRGGQNQDRADRLLSTFVHHFGATGATKAELRNVAEMPPATFHRAINDLLELGSLVNDGTDKRPFYRAAS